MTTYKLIEKPVPRFSNLYLDHIPSDMAYISVSYPLFDTCYKNVFDGFYMHYNESTFQVTVIFENDHLREAFHKGMRARKSSWHGDNLLKADEDWIEPLLDWPWANISHTRSVVSHYDKNGVTYRHNIVDQLKWISENVATHEAIVSYKNFSANRIYFKNRDDAVRFKLTV